MSVYGNTNSRAKSRRTGSCQAFCFACPSFASTTSTASSTRGSLFFPDQSYLQMSSGIVFGSSTTPFTVEAFINSTYGPNGNVVLLGAGSSTGSAPFPNKGLTIINTTTTNWKVDSSGIAAQQFTFPLLAADIWYYLAVTRDTSGYIQMFLGTNTSGVATASLSGRQLLNISDWDLTTPTRQIGAWTNTNSYNFGTYINNLRVTNTNLFATNSATIPVPSSNFTAVTGTQLLINDGTFIDQTGNQTLTAVGTPSTSVLAPF
jgi:hypothetical protein